MELWNQYVDLVNGWKLVTIVVLIIANFVFGVVAGLKDGTFQMNKIAEYLQVRVLYYVLGYFTLALVALINNDFAALVPTSFATIVAFFTTRIYSQFQTLIPLPTIAVSGRTLLGTAKTPSR